MIRKLIETWCFLSLVFSFHSKKFKILFCDSFDYFLVIQSLLLLFCDSEIHSSQTELLAREKCQSHSHARLQTNCSAHIWSDAFQYTCEVESPCTPVRHVQPGSPLSIRAGRASIYFIIAELIACGTEYEMLMCSSTQH